MPTSQDIRIWLQQQYHHLPDWDNYDTSIPHHLRSHSVEHLRPSASHGFLQMSPKKLIFSLQRAAQPVQRFLEAYDKKAIAAEIESQFVPFDGCSSSSSSSVSFSWDENVDEGSSSFGIDDDGLREKDEVTGEKQGMQSRWWLGILMVAVAVGVFSFDFVFPALDVGQLLTPT